MNFNFFKLHTPKHSCRLPRLKIRILSFARSTPTHHYYHSPMLVHIINKETMARCLNVLAILLSGIVTKSTYPCTVVICHRDSPGICSAGMCLSADIFSMDILTTHLATHPYTIYLYPILDSEYRALSWGFTLLLPFSSTISLFYQDISSLSHHHYPSNFTELSHQSYQQHC